MESLKERFLRYIDIPTQSDEEVTDRTPTTENQWDLARLLENELNGLGLREVSLNAQCFLTAVLPANTTQDVPTIGFLAHMDTSPDFNGEGIKPQVIENYTGTAIPLKGVPGMALSPQDFPALRELQGGTLITTDGTTLLGADDKAGIAAIMVMLETLVENPDIPHGTIKVAFTPDEETGMGITHFDAQAFDADFAYTVDGGPLGEIEYQNFNAARAVVQVHGVSVHPGSAKNVMKNASLIFMEFNSLLPAAQRPEHTEGTEGFYHLVKTDAGTVSDFKGHYIIRDHDADKFEQKKQYLHACADLLNQKYGEATVVIEMKEQYRNMEEVIQPVFHVVEAAQQAMRDLDIEPITKPIRGGTDGARLSYMGLPTPNLFNGGDNFHGPYEYLHLETAEKAVAVILRIIAIYAGK